MSAYICDDELFCAIATYAHQHNLLDGYTRQSFIDALVTENYRSVNYRYNESGEPHSVKYSPIFKTAAEIEKLCNTYDYQACEHSGYDRSDAKRILEAIKTHATKQAKDDQRQAREQAAREQEEALQRGKSWIEQNKPSWAEAVIVARLQQDESDSLGDLFLSRTIKTIVLAWSKHTRDLFSEMRKAADKCEQTQHLGTDKGLYRITPNRDPSDSRIMVGYHYSLSTGGDNAFSTHAEAEEAAQQQTNLPHGYTIYGDNGNIEHREKYTGGKGYYLARHSYSGWKVEKTYLADQSVAIAIGNGDHLLTQPDQTSATEPAEQCTNTGVTIRRNADKNGIELIFAEKPNEATRDRLKALRFRFSRFQSLWYAQYSDRLWQQITAEFSAVTATDATEATPPEPEQAEQSPKAAIEKLTGCQFMDAKPKSFGHGLTGCHIEVICRDGKCTPLIELTIKFPRGQKFHEARYSYAKGNSYVTITSPSYAAYRVPDRIWLDYLLTLPMIPSYSALLEGKQELTEEEKQSATNFLKLLYGADEAAQSEPKPTEPQGTEPEQPEQPIEVIAFSPIDPNVLNTYLSAIDEQKQRDRQDDELSDLKTQLENAWQEIEELNAEKIAALEALQKIKYLVTGHPNDRGQWRLPEPPHIAVLKINEIANPAIEALLPKTWDGQPIAAETEPPIEQPIAEPKKAEPEPEPEPAQARKRTIAVNPQLTLL